MFPRRGRKARKRLVPQARIELATYPLPRGCATTTLLRRTIAENFGAKERCYSP